MLVIFIFLSNLNVKIIIRKTETLAGLDMVIKIRCLNFSYVAIKTKY